MPRYDLVTIGELLYILRSGPGERLKRARTLTCHASGAEANVAVGLSNLGWAVGYLTKVRDNFAGRFIVDELLGQGVDTSSVVWTSTRRVGLIFQELGAHPRPSESVYDREHSAFTTLMEDEVDWGLVHSSGSLYLSGVTAALGESSRRLLLRAVAEARSAGIQVIFDFNYRSTLWPVPEAREFFFSFLEGIDLLFLKYADACNTLGLEGQPEAIIEQIRSKYAVKTVVMSLGKAGAVAGDGKIARVDAIDAVTLNRFGIGDAFNAGFLYGYSDGDLNRGLEYGRALAALKATYINDNFSVTRRSELERLVNDLSMDDGPFSGTDIVR